MENGVKVIDTEGKYVVRIVEPHWEQMKEKDGDAARMCLVLPGYYEEDDGTNVGIDGKIYFTRAIISGGQYAGKSSYSVSAAKCEEFGIDAPFSPDKIDQLEGVELEFVVEEETTNKGNTFMSVKYINTLGSRRKTLSKSEAAKIWAELTESGSEPVSTPAKPAAKKDDLGLDDDIPFGD